MELVGSLLYGADEQVSQFVQEKIGCGDFGHRIAVGVVKDAKLIAGVVYHEWRGFDVRVSIAIEGGGFLPWRTLFGYAFNQLGCVRITCVIHKKNKRSRLLCEKLGFKLEGVQPLGLDGKHDAVIYGLLKKQCRWLKDKETNGPVQT